MITVQKNLSELRKSEKNIRRHSDKQIGEYIRSIEMFGQVRPLVCDENGVIIAGNGMFEALTRMGRTTCDCYVMVGLTEVQKKKLMMADNKVYELGFTDTDVIEELVKELGGDVDVPGWDADLLEMLGASIEEANDIVDSYGVYDQAEVGTLNRRQAESHTPAAPAVYAPPTAQQTVAAPMQPQAAPVSAEVPHAVEDGQKRVIRCPKCGELICL